LATRPQHQHDNCHLSDGFVLQNSQNRHRRALRAKLDALILTSQVQNKLAGIEKLDEQQPREMSQKLTERAECVADVAED